VTVVIPCFNQGRFLREALLSVQFQTLTDRAHIIDTGSDSYHFRRTVEKRKKKT